MTSVQPINLKVIQDLYKKGSQLKYGSLDKESIRLYKKFGGLNTDLQAYKTPCYLLDSQKIKENFFEVDKAFSTHLGVGRHQAYFPVKINNYPEISKIAIQMGFGLEVASVKELDFAREIGAKKILYYAPGKKKEELEYIVRIPNVTIHVDSFGELEMLTSLSINMNTEIHIGVRIFTEAFGDWEKYGIPLIELDRFTKYVALSKNLRLKGIHFHTSRNRNSQPYVSAIEKICETLRNDCDPENIKDIEYIDIGGGFEKSEIEGIYEKGTEYGKLMSLTNSLEGRNYTTENKTIPLTCMGLESYISDISKSFLKETMDLFGKNISLVTELGRYIVSDGMHILTTVTEVRDDGRNSIIVDAGVNLIGWQRGEFEYFPLLNLSNFSTTEIPSIVYGNLCTTWDLWGYWLYSECKPKIGDVILIGNQGTLSYSLAQTFIQPIAPVWIV